MGDLKNLNLQLVHFYELLFIIKLNNLKVSNFKSKHCSFILNLPSVSLFKTIKVKRSRLEVGIPTAENSRGIYISKRQHNITYDLRSYLLDFQAVPKRKLLSR